MPRVVSRKKSDPGKRGGKRASKTLVTPDFLLNLENAVAGGADTLMEMSAAMGMKVATFETMIYGSRKNGHIEAKQVNDAIEAGKSRRRERFQQLAENSLRKLVCGYEYDEVTREKGISGDKEVDKTKVTRKHVQPSTAAVIFALCNTGKWQQPKTSEIRQKDGSDEIDLSIPGFDPAKVVATYETPQEDDPDGSSTVA